LGNSSGFSIYLNNNLLTGTLPGSWSALPASHF